MKTLTGMLGLAAMALAAQDAARLTVMGGEQAASVLATFHRDADRWIPEQAEESKAPIRQKYKDEGNPYYATARGSACSGCSNAISTVQLSFRDRDAPSP